MDAAKDPQSIDATRFPHVFEIQANSSVTYYVGEDPTCGGKEEERVTSPESGVGFEQAKHWEVTLRQALMPVTPNASVEPAEGELEKRPNRPKEVKPDISQHYQINPEDVLGSGQFGIVYGGKHTERMIKMLTVIMIVMIIIMIMITIIIVIII